MSRSDFLADRKKPHRQEGCGVGTYRYFMCPEGLITIDDLPDRWGLLWVNSRGHVTVMAGHVTCCMSDGYRGHEWETVWAFDADRITELNMLACMFKLTGDHDAFLQERRSLNRILKKREETVSKLEKELKSLNIEHINMYWELERYREHFGIIPANANDSFRWERFKRLIQEEE
ncbi:adenylosuccinate synthase [Dickeya sp. NCPPB 3274]|uniref:adenylosuccinate synthase n=1 Tax=Dickeya sp. NCPPB 3274 TaxID=568766 RepID=UPI001268ABBF|nr:adenylosuccinate synthase [Dickeya sp. NCPPB 3274]